MKKVTAFSLAIIQLVLTAPFAAAAQNDARDRLCGTLIRQAVRPRKCGPHLPCADIIKMEYFLDVGVHLTRVETADEAVFTLLDKNVGEKICVTGYFTKDGSEDVFDATALE